jgi:predicted CopG family antitoxin
MPTITLRIGDEEHDTLREMAKWKGVSLSDLIREYSRTGVRQDAANTSIREEIRKTIEQEKERLERVGELLERAARAGTPTITEVPDLSERTSPGAGRMPSRGTSETPQTGSSGGPRTDIASAGGTDTAVTAPPGESDASGQ